MSEIPTAYSYIRFSTPEQSKGDSLRRQTEAAAKWCGEHGARLDTSTTFRDLGKSAFLGEHRKNPDRHRLAAFLKLVEDGKVPRGSYLIIESLDRLTREHVRAGLMLLLGLIEAGIRIVQLSPSELVYDERSDEMGLMLAIVELSRGHRESQRKSDLIGAAWRKKKEKSRNGGIVTERLPAWVEIRDGKLVLIPAAAAAVKLIFEFAANGYGSPRIVAKLTKDGVPPIGKTGKWVKAYVIRILSDRRAIGEYQPRRGPKREPDGEPVADYFPAVVSEEDFYAARAGAAERLNHDVKDTIKDSVIEKVRQMFNDGKTISEIARTTKRSRPTIRHILRKGDDPLVEPKKRRALPPSIPMTNIFAGLLKNAREGDSYSMTMRTQRTGPPRYHVLINANSQEGRAPCYAIPYLVFERAILGRLAEIDPKDIVGGNGAASEAAALSGEFAELESAIASISADLDTHGESPALYARMRKKEDRKKEVVKLLEAARRKAAHPLAESWGEAQTLLSVLDNSPDPEDVRVRLRSALRRIVTEARILVVPRKLVRLVAVQIHFNNAPRPRHYLIYYRPPHHTFAGRKDKRLLPLSLADVIQIGDTELDLDLRDRDQAAALEAVLAEMDLEQFEQK